MKKIFLIAALAASLASCQSLGTIVQVATASGPNPVSAKMVLELRSGYDAAFLAPASNYARLPRCSRNPAPCSEQKIVNALRRADRSVEPVLTEAERFVFQHPTLNASAYYSLAVSAINRAKTIGLTYGIGG